MTTPNKPNTNDFIDELQQTDKISTLHLQMAQDIFATYEAEYSKSNKIPALLNKAEFVNDIAAYYGPPEWFIDKIRNQQGKVLWLQIYLKLQWFYLWKLDGKVGPVFLQAVQDKLTVKHELYLLNKEFSTQYNKYANIVNQMSALLKKEKLTKNDEVMLISLRAQISNVASVFEKHLSKSLLWSYQKKVQMLMSKYNNIVSWVPPYEKATKIFSEKTTTSKLFGLYQDETTKEWSQWVYDALKSLPTVVRSYKSNTDLLNYLESIHNQITSKAFASKTQSDSYFKMCKWVDGREWLHQLIFQRLNKQVEQDPKRPWLIEEVLRYISITTDRYHGDLTWRLKDELEEPEQAKLLLKQVMLKTGMLESRLVENPLDTLYLTKKINNTDLLNYYITLPLKPEFKEGLISIATTKPNDLTSDQKLQLLIMQDAIPRLKLSKDPSTSLPEIFGKSTQNVMNSVSVIWTKQAKYLASKIWDDQWIARRSSDLGFSWSKAIVFDMYQDIAGSGKLNFADETNAQMKQYAKMWWAIAAGIAAWFFTAGTTWAALWTAALVWWASNVVIDQAFDSHGYDSIGEGVKDVASNFVVWAMADVTGGLLNGQVVKAWVKIVSKQTSKAMMSETLQRFEKNPNLTTKWLHMLSGVGNATLNIWLEWARREWVFDEEFDIINCISNGGFGIALWVMMWAMAGKTPRKLLETENNKLKLYASTHPEIMTQAITLWGQTMKWSQWMQQLDIQMDATTTQPKAQIVQKDPTTSSVNSEEVKKSIKTKKRSVIETNKNKKPIATEQDPYKAYLDNKTTANQQIDIMKQWMKDHDVPQNKINRIKPATWKAILDLHNDPKYPWVRKHNVEQLLEKIAKLDKYPELKDITYTKTRKDKNGDIKSKKEKLSKWLVKEWFVATPQQILSSYNAPADPLYIPIPKITIPTITQVDTPYAYAVLQDINVRIAWIRSQMIDILSKQKSKLDKPNRTPEEQISRNTLNKLESSLQTNMGLNFNDIDVKQILNDPVVIIDGTEIQYAKPLLWSITKLIELENIITTQKNRIISERAPHTGWWITDTKRLQLNKEEAELDKLSSFIWTLKAEFSSYSSKQNAQFTWYEYRNYKDFELPFLNAKELFDSKPNWKVIIYDDVANPDMVLSWDALAYKISDPSVEYIKISDIHNFIREDIKKIYFSQWEQSSLLKTKEYANFYREKLESIAWEIEAYSGIKKDGSGPDVAKVKDKDLNKIPWLTTNDVKSAVKSYEVYDSSFRKRDDINDFIGKFEAWDPKTKDIPNILISDKQYGINMLAMSKTQIRNLISWPTNRWNLLRAYHMSRIMRHLYNEWGKYDVSFKDGKIYGDAFKDVVLSSMDNVDEIIAWEMKKSNYWSFLINWQWFAQDRDDAAVHYRRISSDLIKSWDSGYVVEYGKMMQKEVYKTLILWGKVPTDIEILSTKYKADIEAAWKNKSTWQIAEEFLMWTYKEKTYLTKALASIPYIWSNKLAEKVYMIIDVCRVHERIFTALYAAYNLWVGGMWQMWVGWLATNVIPGTPFLKRLLVGLHTGVVQKIAPWLRDMLTPEEKKAAHEAWSEIQKAISTIETQTQNVRWLLQWEDLEKFNKVISDETSMSVYSPLTQKILDSNDPVFIKEQTDYVQQCIDARNLVITAVQSEWSNMDQYDQSNHIEFFDWLIVQNPSIKQTVLLEQIIENRWNNAKIIGILKWSLTKDEEWADVADSEERAKRYSRDDESWSEHTDESWPNNADIPEDQHTEPVDDWPYAGLNEWTIIHDIDTWKLMIVTKDENWVKYLKPKE